MAPLTCVSPFVQVSADLRVAAMPSTQPMMPSFQWPAAPVYIGPSRPVPYGFEATGPARYHHQYQPQSQQQQQQQQHQHQHHNPIGYPMCASEPCTLHDGGAELVSDSESLPDFSDILTLDPDCFKSVPYPGMGMASP
jgi:hypothetical protein